MQSPLSLSSRYSISELLNTRLERALRHRNHVSRLYRVVVGQVALLQNFFQMHRVRGGGAAIALTIELGTIRHPPANSVVPPAAKTASSTVMPWR